MTKVTCVICPKSCVISASEDGSLSGYKCERGLTYARAEITNPVRNISSTVRLSGSSYSRVPVKTDKPIAKDKIFDAMREINKIKINAPFKIKMGDVLYSDFTETGINLVAGSDIEEK